MKGATSVVLASLIDFAPQILSSSKSLLLIITTDEETGANDGVQSIASKNLLSFDTCIVPDTGE